MIVTREPFTLDAAVVADHADHFVEVRSHLDAASQSYEGRVAFVSRRESLLLGARLHVQPVEPGVRDVHGALGTVDTRRVEIKGHLMGPHLVLLVSAAAVSPDTWRPVPLQDFKERLAWVGLVAPGDTIGWNTVDPDHLVVHLDAAVGG